MQINFSALFEVESPVLELFLRGTILYVGILFLMRLLPRRTGGQLEVMDLVFILLITEGASHAMGDYTSISEGFIVILTILGWSFLINVLSYHNAFIAKLVAHPEIRIIKDGKLLRRNMRREFLTEDELMGHLRTEGIEDISKVKKACMESDGSISVVKVKE